VLLTGNLSSNLSVPFTDRLVPVLGTNWLLFAGGGPTGTCEKYIFTVKELS